MLYRNKGLNLKLLGLLILSLFISKSLIAQDLTCTRRDTVRDLFVDSLQEMRDLQDYIEKNITKEITCELSWMNKDSIIYTAVGSIFSTNLEHGTLSQRGVTGRLFQLNASDQQDCFNQARELVKQREKFLDFRDQLKHSMGLRSNLLFYQEASPTTIKTIHAQINYSGNGISILSQGEKNSDTTQGP